MKLDIPGKGINPVEKTTLTRKEAAQRMGVAPATIDRLIRDGEIPFYRPSPRRIVIPREAFDRWLDSRAAQTRKDV